MCQGRTDWKWWPGWVDPPTSPLSGSGPSLFFAAYNTRQCDPQHAPPQSQGLVFRDQE